MPRKKYSVKEIFYTLQGEGENAGSAAVFCRFAGCNGWSGLERDRNKGPFPCSKWCDTNFINGYSLDEDQLIDSIMKLFVSEKWRFLVFSGGEPGLQLTDSLIKRLKQYVPRIAIETNGSLLLPAEAFNCWITVSPKQEKVVQDRCSELKLIYPTIPPEKFDYIDAPFRFLQPLDGPHRESNTKAAIEYVKAHTEWRLSLQTHKMTGIP